MDAKRTPRWAWACCLLLLGGCTQLTKTPSAQQEQVEPAESRERNGEPPQVVETAPGPGAETVEDEDANSAIQRYIERVDDAGTRARERQRWRMSTVDAARQVADEQPAPPITVIPESDNPPTTQPASQPAADAPEPTSQPAPPPTPALDPPVLGFVTVRAATDRQIAPVQAVAPTVNTPAVARGAPASLRDLIDRVVLPDGDSFRTQLDARILRVVAGDHEAAREPLKLVTAEQQELAARFVEALIVIRDGHMGDPQAAASAAARELTQALQALRSASELHIPVVKICSAVRGYGQYDAIEPPRFLAGAANEFVLYSEVTDFVSEQRGDEYYTTFDLTTTILSRAGDTLLELNDPQIVDRCRNRRHDCFIPRLVRLPATLSPGHYVAKVTIADTLGSKVAESRAAFELVARP